MFWNREGSFKLKMNNIYTVEHESLQHVKERKADEGEFFTIYLIINFKNKFGLHILFKLFY